jgi:hypothetical protein
VLLLDNDALTPAEVEVWTPHPRQDLGDVVRVFARFTSDGQPVNPTTVQAMMKPPTGVPEDVEVQPHTAGLYRVDVLADESGVWRVRFLGGGLYIGASPDFMFHVRTSVFSA